MWWVAQCGTPATAQAYVFNATVVPAGALGYLTLWPDGADQPLVSTLNALDGSITTNMAIVPSTNGKVDALCVGTHATDPRHLQLLRAVGQLSVASSQLSVVSKTTADPSTPAARRRLRSR